MDIRRVEWSDTDGVRRLVAVREAVRIADSPWRYPETERGCAGAMRHGWDGDPSVHLLATVDGVDVATAQYETPTYDNRHLAWFDIDVHPDHRRRGHGSELLAHLLERTAADGRTSAGMGGWDGPGPRGFAAAHGFEPKAVEVNRRQYPAKLDRAELDRLYDELLPHAASYELVRLLGPTPPEELEAMARMVAAINDAPTDDLDVEDEAFPPERIVAYETAQQLRGFTVHRVLARHRGTGEPAGHTVVVVDGELPHLAHQHDTSVTREHRGHRLGALLKLEMLRWLAEAQPQLESIDTWNAESNDHMIEVNRALGYEVVGRALAFQRAV
jgi:GNAT superfamily N-acetyltransferase